MRSSPCSGRTCADGPHFGPPMAPNNTASAARHSSSVSCGSGSPCRSMAAPPNGAGCTENSCLNLAATRSSTRTPSATTSGPMPSPAMTAILAFIRGPSALRAFVGRDRVVLRQEEAELVDSVEQAILRESFERELHGRAVGQRERGRCHVDRELRAGGRDEPGMRLFVDDNWQEPVLET